MADVLVFILAWFVTCFGVLWFDLTNWNLPYILWFAPVKSIFHCARVGGCNRKQICLISNNLFTPNVSCNKTKPDYVVDSNRKIWCVVKWTRHFREIYFIRSACCCSNQLLHFVRFIFCCHFLVKTNIRKILLLQ